MNTVEPHLSRRETQIMEIIYELGSATAAEVRERLADGPSYSAVRALLRVLEEKGHLHHEQDGPRYVFLPTVPRDDSAEGAVAALIDLQSSQLEAEDYDRLVAMIERARKEGR